MEDGSVWKQFDATSGSKNDSSALSRVSRVKRTSNDKVGAAGMGTPWLGGLLPKVITDQNELIALGLGQGAATLVNTEIGLSSWNVAFLTHGLHHLC